VGVFINFAVLALVTGLFIVLITPPLTNKWRKRVSHFIVHDKNNTLTIEAAAVDVFYNKPKEENYEYEEALRFFDDIERMFSNVEWQMNWGNRRLGCRLYNSTGIDIKLVEVRFNQKISEIGTVCTYTATARNLEKKKTKTFVVSDEYYAGNNNPDATIAVQLGLKQQESQYWKVKLEYAENPYLIEFGADEAIANNRYIKEAANNRDYLPSTNQVNEWEKVIQSYKTAICGLPEAQKKEAEGIVLRLEELSINTQNNRIAKRKLNRFINRYLPLLTSQVDNYNSCFDRRKNSSMLHDLEKSIQLVTLGADRLKAELIAEKEIESGVNVNVIEQLLTQDGLVGKREN